MIAPVIVGLVGSVLLYVVLSALFGPAAGALAIIALGTVGFIAWLGTLMLAAR